MGVFEFLTTNMGMALLCVLAGGLVRGTIGFVASERQREIHKALLTAALLENAALRNENETLRYQLLAAGRQRGDST